MFTFLSFLVVLFECLLLIKSENTSEECAVNDKQNEINGKQSVPQRRQQRSEISVEIGVYFDIHLRRKFNNNDEEVQKYIKALMSGAQTVFNYPTMRTRVTLIVTHFEIVSNESVPYVHDIYDYHDAFCEWQSGKARVNYDLAVLLTSKNLFVNGTANMNGYAPIATVCQSKNNCAIIKASYVSSMWTIAHEIGHKIGISHDDQNCGPAGVMNRTPEKPFHWTNYSNNYLEIFLASRQFSECLFRRSGQQLNGWTLSSVDFHSYSMEEQCALNFGPKYKPYPLMVKVCLALPCVYDLVQPLNSGAPLEMSVCRNKTFNFFGKCVRSHCLRS